MFGNQPSHPPTFGKDIPKNVFFIPSLKERGKLCKFCHFRAEKRFNSRHHNCILKTRSRVRPCFTQIFQLFNILHSGLLCEMPKKVLWKSPSKEFDHQSVSRSENCTIGFPLIQFTRFPITFPDFLIHFETPSVHIEGGQSSKLTTTYPFQSSDQKDL